jgi:hypothetical protein
VFQGLTLRLAMVALATKFSLMATENRNFTICHIA